MKEQIVSKKGAKPGGAYSPGIRAGDFVFVSGQGPIDPTTNQIVGTTIEEQTRRTLDNVKAILEGAGCTMDDVVKSSVHLLDIKMFDRYNKVYSEYFKDPKPARTTVQSGLWSNILVEIDVVAYKPVK
jgi:2-iminobutanoate/2-iminopropanoate deaminase